MDTNMCDLPDDLLLGILRCLPARAFARSRAVCRSWRAIIDVHSLLLRQSFPPGAFPGIFTNNFGCKDESYFLAPPDTSSSPDEFRRPLFWHGWACVDHHCNGLLLLRDKMAASSRSPHTYVCNPATRRCAPLPRTPALCRSRYEYEGRFLAFDPAVSPHYEVFRLHRPRKVVVNNPAHELMIIEAKVFSSRSNKWEQREFTLAGRHTPSRRRLYDVVTGARGMKWPCAEYWRGSLYVCCQNGVLLVLHCSRPGGGTYDMVQLPGRIYNHAGQTYQLPRRSLVASHEGGVRYVELDRSKLRVWALVESGGDDGRLGWTLAHESGLGLSRWKKMMWKKAKTIQSTMTHWEMVASSSGPFSLFEQSRDKKKKQEEDEDPWSSDDDSCTEEEESWNSDEDNFVELEEEDGGREDVDQEEERYGHYCGIIGLHPHKDVLLLDISGTAVAYHLRTSRMQYLSRWLYREPESHGCGIEGAFPYRPCYVDVLPTSKISQRP